MALQVLTDPSKINGRKFFFADVEEMTTKKDASKEKILTQTQRARFDAIFPNYIERFRRMPPPAPANAAQTNAGASMAPTDASTGLTPADGNLPSKRDSIDYKDEHRGMASFSRKRRANTLRFSNEHQ